jgi:hypothetical protein
MADSKKKGMGWTARIILTTALGALARTGVLVLMESMVILAPVRLASMGWTARIILTTALGALARTVALVLMESMVILAPCGWLRWGGLLE